MRVLNSVGRAAAFCFIVARVLLTILVSTNPQQTLGWTESDGE